MNYQQLPEFIDFKNYLDNNYQIKDFNQINLLVDINSRIKNILFDVMSRAVSINRNIIRNGVLINETKVINMWHYESLISGSDIIYDDASLYNISNQLYRTIGDTSVKGDFVIVFDSSADFIKIIRR